jgi:NADPH2:quinone reductase
MLTAPAAAALLFVVALSRESMTKNVRYQFIHTYTVTDEQKQHTVAAVSEARKAGALRAGEEHGLPPTRFPLQATAAAHDVVEQRHR